jgi:hypothetical protein
VRVCVCVLQEFEPVAKCFVFFFDSDSESTAAEQAERGHGDGRGTEGRGGVIPVGRCRGPGL